MNHDRLHARKPTHDIERWSTGTVEALERRDGHCIVTVSDGDDELDPTVRLAIRDLFGGRLDLPADASPADEQIWYRKYGG